MDSSIYTAFKEAPAYETTTDMYFPKAFCESPSAVIMAAQPCRDTDDKTFLHTYWFGDAASDAVSIFNTDLYTNKAFTTDQDVYAKYLAVGRYSAKADWARDFILKALSYKRENYVGNVVLKTYFMKEYNRIFNTEFDITKGWCSEFASVTLHESKLEDGISYPHEISVRRFVSELSDKHRFFMITKDSLAADSTHPFVPATKDATFDKSHPVFGAIRKSDQKDFRFSCTKAAGNPVIPEIGDIIFFNTSATCHTGIVINTNGSYVFTVEGNVSEASAGIGTKTDNTVLHRRRKITVTEGNVDRMVGIGKVYQYPQD